MTPRRPRLSVLALSLALSGGWVAAQDGNTGVIDLGPMLDAMSDSGLGVPDPATATETTAPIAPDQPPAVLPAYVRNEASAAATATQAQAPVIVPLLSQPYTPILRMSGEVGRGSLTFDIEDPRNVSGLHLAVRSSVSLLPAQSRLQFAINGTEVANIEPFAFDAFEPISLPTDQIRAGRNQIDITATGAHRIFCGPDASFEIWTEVDLGQSGVTLAMPPSTTGAAPLRSALATQILRHGRVTLQTSQDIDPTLLRALRGRITALLPGAAPELVLRDPYSPLEAGAVADLAYISLLPAASPFITLRRAASGAQVLVIGGIPDAAMLDDWLPEGAAVGDLPAVAPGAQTAGVTLADLGAQDILLESRYAKSTLPFTLPEDWFLIAAQEANIALDYSYAAGLPEGSLMLVKVNGTTIRLLPLHGQGNTLLPTLDMGFPVRLLQAGANEISFEAIIPGDPPDLPCSPVAGPMVRIGATTTIEIPPSPAMHVPRVADLLRALTPDAITLIEGATPGAIGDRVRNTLTARMTPIAGHEGQAQLVVSGLGPVDRAPLDAIGLSRQRLEFLLAPQAVATAQPPADSAFVTRAKTLAANVVQLAWPGDPPLDQWLDGKTGEALLFVDQDDSNKLWMIVAPSANPQRVAHALADARFDPQGPKGEAAVLMPDGTWDVWTPASRVPQLRETLTIGNFRAVAGNYASWNPLYFVAILTLFVTITVGLALSFITRTRGQRKR